MANLFGGSVITDSCLDPKYNGRNLTNRVLVEVKKIHQEKYQVDYYVPAYLRLKIKNFADLNLENLAGAINQVLILTISVQHIPKQIVELIKKKLTLRFNRDEALQLKPSNKDVNVRGSDSQIQFTVRKLLNAGMIPEVFFSPLEIINLVLSIELQSIFIGRKKIESLQIPIFEKDLISKFKNQSQSKEKEQHKDNNQEKDKNKEKKDQIIQQINVHFNLMDLATEKDKHAQDAQDVDHKNGKKQGKNMKKHQEMFKKISYTEEGTLGSYDLAEALLQVEYSNDSLALKIKQSGERGQWNCFKKSKEEIRKAEEKNMNFGRINPFCFGHFIIPLYKFPLVTLFTIFLPLLLLGVINLGIFFQDNGLADRIASLATLMIAFVALIPVIREQIPPTPNITLVELLVYLETVITILCFIRSIDVRDVDGFVFDWRTDEFFIASCVIFLLEIVMAVLGVLIYAYRYFKVYNLSSRDMPPGDLKRQEWSNIQCDQHFRRKLDNGIIKIFRSVITQEQAKEIAKKQDDIKKQKELKEQNKRK